MTDVECERLLVSSHDWLRRFCVRLNRGQSNDQAEDLAQEARLVTWQARGSITRPNPRAYLAKVAVNLYRESLRRKKLVNEVCEPGPLNAAFGKFEQPFGGILPLRLSELTAWERRVAEYLTMGFTLTEIAREIGVGLSTTKSRMAPARIKIRELLERQAA